MRYFEVMDKHKSQRSSDSVSVIDNQVGSTTSRDIIVVIVRSHWWIGIILVHPTEDVLRSHRDLVEGVFGCYLWVGEDGVGGNDWVIG